MLTKIGENIHVAEGPPICGAVGFHYPTRMIVITLPDGGLFLWSPVELNDGLKTVVDALGPVSYLIAPNTLHHMHIGDWKAANPDARLIGPAELVDKRPDLSFDGVLEDPPAGWANAIDQVVIDGNRIMTEVVFFHRESGTVIFTDLIQQMPRGWYTGWRAIVARLDLMTAPRPEVPRKFRAAFRDRKAAKAQIQRIMDWPVETIVMAHGPVVTRDAKRELQRMYQWLL